MQRLRRWRIHICGDASSDNLACLKQHRRIHICGDAFSDNLACLKQHRRTYVIDSACEHYVHCAI